MMAWARRVGVIFLLMATNCNWAESFVLRHSLFTRMSEFRSCFKSTSMYRSTLTKPLKMSSIPDEDEYPTPRSIFKSVKESLPPLPEDHIALSGDVVAVFVYSYLDHTAHDLCEEATRMDVGEYLTTIDSVNAPPLPVWFDVTHINDFGHWLADYSSSASYAPAIASGGLAFVVMATCWIVSGYFSGAFLMKNTLECDSKNALLVTGKTWFIMAVLMVGFALGSDALWQELDMIHPLSDPARGGLTKSDADYIFDSLSVLAFWRWIFNYLMGYR